MNGGVEELPPLLKTIDEKLVLLEQKRNDTALMAQLAELLDDFTQTASPLEKTPILTGYMSQFLHSAETGDMMLSSPAFEKLFNAMALIQEQLEWFEDYGDEVESSLWDPLQSQIQALANPQKPELLLESTSFTTSLSSQGLSTDGAGISPSRGMSDQNFGARAAKFVEMLKEVEDVTYAGDIEAIRNQLAGCIQYCESSEDTAAFSADTMTETMSSILDELQIMVRQWAMVQGKEVELVIGEETHVRNKKILPTLREALFQCTEYLIEGSLESSANRRNKSSVGHIYIDITEEGENILISVTDDGRGFRSDFLKNRALEKKIVSSEKIRTMPEQEIWNLLFQESMFSADDAEVGSNFPELKSKINELGGEIGLESIPGEMSSFILVFPIGDTENIATIDIPIEIPQGFSTDLNILQSAVNEIQKIMTQDTPGGDQVKNLEQHVSYIFSSIKHLVNKVNQEENVKGLDLKEIAMVDLFGEVGNITREMHNNLKAFSSMMDSQFQNLALEQIPDAAHRLEHIIEMTEQSANKTLDLAEALTIDSSDTSEDMESLLELLKGAKDNPKNLEEAMMLAEQVKLREAGVNDKLMEVMTAQDYQDRTGQVIRKIIILVNDLEQRLVSLVTKFGGLLGIGEGAEGNTSGESISQSVPQEADALAEFGEEKEVEMYGPQHAKGKGVSNQDDVDSLLAQFGF